MAAERPLLPMWWRDNKLYDNIENDRPDNDNNNNGDDIDCFARQDKLLVLPQDISLNATLLRFSGPSKW